MTDPFRFAIIGTGRRSEFYQRLARLAPAQFRVTGLVSRSGGTENSSGVPIYSSIEELLAAGRPEFVVPCVPWAATALATIASVDAGLPVLAETPPAADRAGLLDLWSRVGASGLVQVAEQYLLMPGHAARLKLVRRGQIGEVTSVQVSSTHLYHAVSMIRGLLDVAFEPVTVHAQSFTAPLADPLTPAGWTGSAEPAPAATTLATLDWGGGRMGLYDFTDNQWWNPLRQRRIVVRGALGEIVDDRIVQLLDPTTPLESQLVRRQTGYDLNLEGLEVRHISHGSDVLWRNDFLGSRFSEDDLAVAALLARMGAWCRDDGPAPYPLAQGCQDHLISLAIGESIVSGASVTTERPPWA